VVVVEVVVVVVAVAACAPPVIAPASLLRDGLDRDATVVVVASANVAIAGVDGLLARPLLVLTTPAGVGWMASADVSFFCAAGSSPAFVKASFLPFATGSAVGDSSSVS
jgi:hypothetical protein